MLLHSRRSSRPRPSRAHTRQHHPARWWTSSIFLNLVLIFGLIISVGPIVWMVLSSFKPESEIRQRPPTFWPQTWTTSNYTELFQKMDFPVYFRNSLIVAVAITIGNLLFCSMVGYALAKIDFPGKKVLFALVLGTLMVPGMVTFVPLYILTADLHMTNTYLALILPYLASAFGVFLMRQFILDIPDELIDAAKVDGAGEIRTFLRIVMPQCKPALATLGILQFLGSWNNFLWPLVAVQSSDMYTLPVALALYTTGQNTVKYGLELAGATVIVIPVILVFILLQRHFVQGIATTGLK